MPAVAVIGNLVKDIVSGTQERPGGAVFYQARAFGQLEHSLDVRLVTRCAPEDRELLLVPLEEFGLPVIWRPARETQPFSFHYAGERRITQIDALGDRGRPTTSMGGLHRRSETRSGSSSAR